MYVFLSLIILSSPHPPRHLFLGFHGSSLARMADGSLKRVDQLCKDDLVFSPDATTPARIVCVIKTLCPTGTTDLVELSPSLLITPYHPVRRTGVWHFPCDLGDVKQLPCDAVYSFVLSDHHVMIIGGEECVSLGHTFTSSSVIAHPYFGSKRIVEDLQQLPGWHEGLVQFARPAMIRDHHSGLISGFAREEIGA